MNSLLVSAVVGLACLGLALLVLRLVQATVHHSVREQHNDVAGFIYAVVGVIYAVLIAFVVIAVWEDFQEAKAIVRTEADALYGLVNDSEQMSDEHGEAIRNLVIAYARSVIDDEWPLMASQSRSVRAEEAMRALHREVAAFEPATDREQVLFDHLLTDSSGLADSRRQRLEVAEEGLHPLLWIALGWGAFLTVSFTYLFGLKNTRSHALMVAFLTSLIVSVLFVIKTMEMPFAGDIRVQPEALVLLLESIETD